MNRPVIRCPHCQSTEFRVRIEYGECLGVERETGYRDCAETEYAVCKRCGQAFSLDEDETEVELAA
jgi:DNA-directed RNA polymerase subunit RPC12/RpoP